MSYPPPPGYGAPGGYPPPGGYGGPAPQQSNGIAIAALVTGILSLTCFPAFALVAIPLALVGMSRAKQQGGAGRGLAIGGLVTGILGLLAGIALIIVLVVAADQIDDIDFRCGSDEISPSGYPCESQGDADPNGGDDGTNSDPADQVCNVDRYFQDPDC